MAGNLPVVLYSSAAPLTGSLSMHFIAKWIGAHCDQMRQKASARSKTVLQRIMPSWKRRLGMTWMQLLMWPFLTVAFYRVEYWAFAKALDRCRQAWRRRCTVPGSHAALTDGCPYRSGAFATGCVADGIGSLERVKGIEPSS